MPKKLKPESAEDGLAFALWVNKIPFEREYRFHAGRRWRADFAFPQFNQKILVEVEGGIWTNGRHTRGAGFSADCEKYNRAAIEGWRVLRFTTEMVNSGAAIQAIRQALGID